MKSFETNHVEKIFERQPIDVATWLVSIDAMHALARVIKHTKVLDNHSDEHAAKRLVKSIGAGDYQTPLEYFSEPQRYSGMFRLASRLGAYSLSEGIDGSLQAALSYKSDRLVRSSIKAQAPALKLYDGARNFPSYFAERAEMRLIPNHFGSVVDTLLSVKTDTEYWIDHDISSL